MTSTTHPLTEYEALLLKTTARRASGKWPRVTAADVEQELWVWALKNLKWIERYRDTVAEPYGKGKLTKAVFKAATAACMGEEAAVTGRRKDELITHDSSYTRERVRVLLTVVWSTDDWPQAIAQANPITGAAMNDGHTDQIEEVRAMLMDVANAVSRLNKRDQQVLHLAYGQGVSAATLAEFLDCSVDAAWKAKERALDRLLRFL